MRKVSSLSRVAGAVSFAAVTALAFAAPAPAADLNTEYAPPPAAYGPPEPAYAAPAPAVAPAPYVAYAPVPYYRPYPYWRPYAWRGYWGPRYAGWYGRPWGWRRW